MRNTTIDNTTTTLQNMLRRVLEDRRTAVFAAAFTAAGWATGVLILRSLDPTVPAWLAALGLLDFAVVPFAGRRA